MAIDASQWIDRAAGGGFEAPIGSEFASFWRSTSVQAYGLESRCSFWRLHSHDRVPVVVGPPCSTPRLRGRQPVGRVAATWLCDHRQDQSRHTIQPMSQTKPDFSQLSIAERIQLVEDIWDSIAAESPAARVF